MALGVNRPDLPSSPFKQGSTSEIEVTHWGNPKHSFSFTCESAVAVHALKGEKTRLLFNIHFHDIKSKLPVSAKGFLRKNRAALISH